MKPQIVLHIGANKTGSSAIQTFIRNNVGLLSQHNYFVPDRLLGTSNKVTGEHVFSIEKYFGQNDTDGLTDIISNLAQHAAKNKKKLLLSGENMSNPGRFNFFAKLASVADIKVIFYIRRQDEFVTSSWQQWHSKIEHDFHGWLILALRQLGNWEQIINGWTSVLGKDAIILRVFERDEFPEGNIMQDFLQCLGIDSQKITADYTGDMSNPSFSDIITPLVAGNRAIFENANDNEFYKLVQKLTGDLYVKKKRVSLLTPIQRDKIIEFYRGQNQRVCQKYFPGRPRLFSAVDHSKYDYLSESEMIDEQMKFLTTMLFKLTR
jgi:hypothetical protein